LPAEQSPSIKDFNMSFSSRIRPFGRWLSLSALGTAIAASLIACGSSHNESTSLRVIHASADAGPVDVRVNGAVSAAGATFKQATAFSSLSVGSTRIQVNPAGSSLSVIDATVSLNPNRDYTVLAVGSASATATSAQAIGAVVIEDSGTAPASGNVKVRVVHAAPSVPNVDIFVTAPTAVLPTAPTIANLPFRSVAPASAQSALEVPGGNYRIRARVTGSTAIAFDSGSVALPANSDLVLAAIPAVGSASPIALLVAPKGGSAFEITDERARVRVGHFSPDVPAVDAFLGAPGDALSAANRVAAGATFPNAITFAAVSPGSYVASVALANQTTAVVTTPATLAARQAASVFAIGLLNGSGASALRLQTYLDDLAPPAAGQAKVRVIHLSPDAPAVDLVTVGAGGAVATVNGATNNLSFPNASAGYLSLPAGTLSVAVVPAGATTPVLPTAAGVPLTLQAGRIYTVAATGCLTPANCGGNGFAFTVLTDN
jgi:hypothetical protein